MLPAAGKDLRAQYRGPPACKRRPNLTLLGVCRMVSMQYEACCAASDVRYHELLDPTQLQSTPFRGSDHSDEDMQGCQAAPGPRSSEMDLLPPVLHLRQSAESLWRYEYDQNS